MWGAKINKQINLLVILVHSLFTKFLALQVSEEDGEEKTNGHAVSKLLLVHIISPLSPYLFIYHGKDWMAYLIEYIKTTQHRDYNI